MSGHLRGTDHPRARFPELHDPAWLRARVAEGMADWEIAEAIDFDCGSHSVYDARKRFGIPAANKPGKRTREVTP